MDIDPTGSMLETKMDKAVRLIRRVVNRHHSHGGHHPAMEIIRLVCAFVLGHFSFVAAMRSWQQAERDKLNILLTKITKRALGIPIRTHIERMLQLGVYNTLE
ncbi:hypothetical protein HPB50_024623 [Hyalomma asiaticum]|uniref:Uncharacterized protein n=1 Tax=Hyalomma asiaticum TaxID=266040 RepID=A0ACB7SKK0_HYAAI|nr:hypothetical protein HPB50_024623 [Hyalomma asiaticum]